MLDAVAEFYDWPAERVFFLEGGEKRCAPALLVSRDHELVLSRGWIKPSYFSLRSTDGVRLSKVNTETSKQSRNLLDKPSFWTDVRSEHNFGSYS